MGRDTRLLRRKPTFQGCESRELKHSNTGGRSNPFGVQEKLSRLRCLFDFLHLSFREREVGGFHVFFQVRHRGSSGDRKHHGTAVQQPGDGKLRDGGSVAFRDIVQLAAGTRELAGCDREPGDEGNIAFAVFENIFMLALADVV